MNNRRRITIKESGLRRKQEAAGKCATRPQHRTVCDIYAALIERRSYKPAMAAGDALRVMQAMSGKLESALVNAFAKILAMDL